MELLVDCDSRATAEYDIVIEREPATAPRRAGSIAPGLPFVFPDAHGNFAGLENGLVASSTNMTRARRSAVPLLEACIGVSGPCPASALPAAIRTTPWGVLKLCSPDST